MDIAQSKRKENIAEYILYLWQLEDLLRALQFSPEAIYSQLVAPRELPDDRKLVFLQWYMEIADLLREETGWNVNTTYTVIKKCVAKGAIQRTEPNFLCHPLLPALHTLYLFNEYSPKMLHKS